MTSSAQVTVPVVAVIVVATHFAIVAINAAVRFGLHEQYYDYVFRYRLQDTFTYRFCALGKRPLDRYRWVSVITPLLEGAVVFAIAACVAEIAS